MDTRSNSRANTCIDSQLFADGTYLLDGNQSPRRIVVNHDNFANRMALCRRWIIQVSALSALDGRVLAYHGFNG